MVDLEKFPLLRNLGHNLEEFHSSLLSIEKGIDQKPLLLWNISVEHEQRVHELFRGCVAWLTEFSRVRDYYGKCETGGWRLNNEHAERALLLDVSTQSFVGIGELISYLAYILPCWLDDEWPGQERPEIWEAWIRAAFDSSNDLMRRLNIAKNLAEINLSAERLHRETNTPATVATAETSHGSYNGHNKIDPSHLGDGVWVRLRQELATENIRDDTIEVIEDRLKDCIRNLVQGRTPHWIPNVRSMNDDNSKPVTSTDGDDGDVSNASDYLVNAETETQRLTAALGRLTYEKDQNNAWEIMDIALQSEGEMDAKTCRRILRILYDTACGDPDQADVYAKFARVFQKTLTPKLQKCMMTTNNSFWNTGNGGNTGPVTSYLENRCWEGWNHGLKGRTQVSTERFALGLPFFVGSLVKHEVLSVSYADVLIRRLLRPDSPIGTTQFVALYHLLRTVGSTIETEVCSSKDMKFYFQRISTLIYAHGAPKLIKSLGAELKEMRRTGWKVAKTCAKSKALSQAIAKVRAESGRETRYYALPFPSSRFESVW